ncbi:hypothetical protein HDV05_005247, partial [Chytridiales sp. JEL 0842]
MICNEPTIRFIALKGAQLASKSIARSLTQLNLQKRLVKLVCDEIHSEPNPKARHLALFIAGETFSFVAKPFFPQPLRRLLLHSITAAFSKSFPTVLNRTSSQSTSASSATALDDQDYQTSQILATRVHLIHAISKSFLLPESENVDFLNYIDELFSACLKPDAHILLQIAVVHVLHTNLPQTNRNRLRIERYYRSLLVELSKVMYTFVSTGTAKTKELSLKTHLLKELYLFWSKWYPRPSDTQLINEYTHDDKQAKLGEGYAARRLQWIFKQQPQDVVTSTAKNSAKDSKAPMVEDVSQEKQPVREGRRDPYVEKEEKVLSYFEESGMVRSTRIKKGVILPHHKPALVYGPRPSQAAPPTQILPLLEFGPSNNLSLDASTLTFNMSTQGITFNRFPFTREIFLLNRSLTHDVPFILQLDPPQYFSVTPAFGKVGRGESLLVTVAYQPNPHQYSRNPEISGFLRVRGLDGYPYERIPLKGYQLPAIKSYPEQVNLGHCPDGETRRGVICIQNILPIECPCVLVFQPSETYSMFSITPSQAVLLPNETKQFQITFSPFITGNITDHLLIVSFGGEVSRVSVHGYSGPSVRVLETKLDFGPTDIFYNAVSRKITLINDNDKEYVPVRFESSTYEITVDEGRSIQLLPGETKQVDVKFLSSITGNRQETLQAFAPDSVIQPIEVEAFSGPTVCIPILEDVIFPTTLTMQPVSIKLPITNLSNGSIHCLITLPQNAPFTIKLLDPEYANRKTLERVSLTIELKPFEGVDTVGGTLSIGPKLTAVLEITFLSSTWGTFRAPLTTQITKPRKLLVGTHYLSAVAVNEAYLSRDAPVDAIARFLANPALEATNGVLLKKSADGRQNNEPDTLQKSSEVFELDPSSLMCFGDGVKGNFKEMYEFVTLTNVASAPRRYKIVLSKPFVTDAPLTGILDGMSCLEIPVRLDPSAFSTSYNRHIQDYSAIGQLTVFDDGEKLGHVSCSLHGTYGDLIGIEVRQNVDAIKFPPLRVMDKYSRRIFIHNKAPFETIWEGRISVADRNFRVEETGTGAEWSPFGLNTTRVNLKPFEFGAVDILFQATSSGDYYARMSMGYIDPVNHVVDGEYQKSRIKRPLRALHYSCTVGISEIECLPDCLNFGDVSVTDKESRALTIQNTQPIDAEILLSCPEPFTVERKKAIISRCTQLEVGILFQSTVPKMFSEFVRVNYGSKTVSIPLFALSGILSLSTSLAKPVKSDLTDMALEAPPALNNCIDFNYVNLTNPKTRSLEIYNTGTLELKIVAITSINTSRLRWKFVGDEDYSQKGANSFAEEAEKYWLEGEEDWDEVDHKAKEDKLVISNTVANASASTDAPKPKEKKKKGKIPATQQPPPAVVQNIVKNFPIRLPPLQTLPLVLSFGAPEMGESITALKIDVEHGSRAVDSYIIWARGNIQPPLKVWDKKIEFGIKAVHGRHRGELKFANVSSSGLAWTLKQGAPKFQPIQKYGDMGQLIDLTTVPSPFSIFPDCGKLQPGCTQTVDVIFSPSIPQYE